MHQSSATCASPYFVRPFLVLRYCMPKICHSADRPPQKAASIDEKSAIAPLGHSLRTKLAHRRTTTPLLLQHGENMATSTGASEPAGASGINLCVGKIQQK